MPDTIKDENGRFKPRPVSKDRMELESTGPQARGDERVTSIVGHGLMYANGGDPFNPMGFPGYGMLYTGTDTNYRWMLQHPVLRLVRSIAVGSIVSSTWEYVKSDKAVPDEQVELIADAFNPIRTQLVNDFYVRGRDHGWACGEPIWESRLISGRMRTVIARVKPLAPEHTEVLEDPCGNMTGLRNMVRVTDVSSVDLPAPYKAWKYTYDSENGYHYGRSWLENVRATAWKDWLDCAQQLQKLGAKITGIITVITSPSGTFPTGRKKADGTYEHVSYKENAELVVKALASGAPGAWMPALGIAVDPKGNIEANKVLNQLAGKPLINVDTKDFGSNAPAILGILDRMKHDEELMFAGGLRPARSGLEGQHGTKAEAGIHTDTGTMNSENDDKDFARQVQPLLAATLAVNVSEKACHNVRISCPSLVDRKTEVIKAFILAAMNVPALAGAIMECLDVTKGLKFLGFSTMQDFDPKKAIESLTQVNKAPATPEPQGGRPKESPRAEGA